MGNQPNIPMQPNGQEIDASGYGKIVDPDVYVNSTYGSGWVLKVSKTIEGISSYTQDTLEKLNGNMVNNCTLTTITKIFEYYRDKGYKKIPSNVKDVYNAVREAGLKHKYKPEDVSKFMFWSIDNVANEAWKNFGYTSNIADTKYINVCITRMADEISALRPFALNLVAGTYKNHTVTGVGYREYKNGRKTKAFIEIYDNYEDGYRYIDYHLLRKFSTTWSMLYSITVLNPKENPV